MERDVLIKKTKSTIHRGSNKQGTILCQQKPRKKRKYKNELPTNHPSPEATQGFPKDHLLQDGLS